MSIVILTVRSYPPWLSTNINQDPLAPKAHKLQSLYQYMYWFVQNIIWLLTTGGAIWNSSCYLVNETRWDAAPCRTFMGNKITPVPMSKVWEDFRTQCSLTLIIFKTLWVVDFAVITREHILMVIQWVQTPWYGILRNFGITRWIKYLCPVCSGPKPNNT